MTPADTQHAPAATFPPIGGFEGWKERHRARARFAASIVTCRACGYSQLPDEPADGRCTRCGLPAKDATLTGATDEERGYRRGYDQGYATALRACGRSEETDPVAAAISDWRHDWSTYISAQPPPE